jgi:anthranilate synthase/aminodeoxychorismate synthase-like glutamine amidotransferase
VHGKVSPVYHNGQGIYAGLDQPFVAGRYHSLLVDRASFPECLTITAQTEEGLIMSLKHNEYHIQGVQFHPESVLTANGIKVFENFLLAV